MSDQRLELTDSELLRKLMQRAPGGPLSVRALAKAAGISKTRVNDLLHGRYATVPTEVATRIARILGVHRDALFIPTASTSMDANVKGGSVEHQRAVDADAYRLVQELGQHEGPVRPDRGRKAGLAPRPVHPAGPRDAPRRHRGAGGSRG